MLINAKWQNLARKSMTLAETLLVILILGVVSAMTIPPLIQSYQESQYKIAYKKAYSDMSQAFMQAMQEQTLTPRTGYSDAIATESEWGVLKNALKVVKECEAGYFLNCWADGEIVYQGHPMNSSKSFIDVSGRHWAEYNYTENIYYVDTNGSKKPNQFGKDRWMFTMNKSNNTRLVSGLPTKIGIYANADLTSTQPWCGYPPCYYYSWLYKN